MTTHDSLWTHESDTGLGTMISVPLTTERFGDMETVFGERGTARRCFCMYWRRPDGDFEDRRDNRDRFADVAAEEVEPAPGLLGYVDDQPVGWVQVGPRARFPTVYRSRLVRPADATEAWSVNCFVVPPRHRRRGVATGLLAAAVEFALDRGAEVVEGYPVDGSRSSANDYYTGTLSMFRPRGFEEVARRSPTRPIVRLTAAGGQEGADQSTAATGRDP